MVDHSPYLVRYLRGQHPLEWVVLHWVGVMDELGITIRRHLGVCFLILFPFGELGAANLSQCPGIFDPNTWHNCVGIYEHEDAFHYSGEFQNGKYHGQGTSSRMSGDKYTGEWKEGQMDGFGVMWFSYGKIWVGHWKSGTWLSGKKYDKGEVPTEIKLLFRKD